MEEMTILHNLQAVLVILLSTRTLVSSFKISDNERILVYGDWLTFHGAHNDGFLVQFKSAVTASAPNATLQHVGLLDPTAGELTVEFDKYVARDDEGLNSPTPSVIIFMLGQGDIARGVSPKDVSDALQLLLIKALTLPQRPRVVLATPAITGDGPASEGASQWEEGLDELAASLYKVAVDYDVGLLDLRFPLQKLLQVVHPINPGHAVLTYDGRVLNPAGHHVILRLFLSYFELAPPREDRTPLGMAPSVHAWQRDTLSKLANLKMRRVELKRMTLGHSARAEL